MKWLGSSILVAVLLGVFSPAVAFAASCSVSAPSNVSASPGPQDGQVTLRWNTVPNIDRYTLVYGTESNKYIYGAVNIGNQNVSSYTVSSLNPGTKYFFKIGAVKGCTSLSSEVSEVAKGVNKNTQQNVLGISTRRSKGKGQVLGSSITANTYTVQTGDSLSQIAGRAYGDIFTFDRIAKANNIANPNLIIPGAVLRIP